MTEKVDFREQFLLRVKKGSEIDRALQALLAGPKTKAELQKAGGKARTFSAVRRFDKWFDNIAITTDFNDPQKRTSFHYTPILPQQVQVVTSDVSFGEGGAQVGGVPGESAIRWPIAPPLIDKMENFDKPSFFETMRKMVRLGHHIALESPPGIGKDTAVQQLAAEEGKPLVTIGGDAGFRRRDLVGTMQIAQGTSYFDVAEYVTAAVNGWWVLITEVNAADPDALIYINAQLAPPYIVTMGGKAYPVHPDFRLFVTYNAGLVGTKPLPQSFKDRFFSIKIPFFSEASLRNRLEAMGMQKAWLNEDGLVEIGDQGRSDWPDVVVKFGRAMWEAHERGQMRYQITTRRLNDAVVLMSIDGYRVREALKDAVIAAIDSPVEAKAAERVLDECTRGM